MGLCQKASPPHWTTAPSNVRKESWGAPFLLPRIPQCRPRLLRSLTTWMVSCRSFGDDISCIFHFLWNILDVCSLRASRDRFSALLQVDVRLGVTARFLWSPPDEFQPHSAAACQRHVQQPRRPQHTAAAALTGLYHTLFSNLQHISLHHLWQGQHFQLLQGFFPPHRKKGLMLYLLTCTLSKKSCPFQ